MDFFTEYKKEILAVAMFLIRPTAIFTIALAVVYSLGRMIGVLKTPQTKNFIALMVIVACNFFYAHFFLALAVPMLVVDVVLYSAIAIVLYTLIGFSLYDRVDAFLDKRFASDDEKKALKEEKAIARKTKRTTAKAAKAAKKTAKQ